MKAPQFYITSALGALCLILTIASIVLGKTNNSLLQTQQQQQEEINKGNMSIQYAQNIVRDMAQASLQNTQIRDVLTKNGITVNAAPSPAQTPATTPTK
jgi:hypothetical protein